MGAGRVLTGAGLAAMVAVTVVALLANTSNPPSGQSASPELRVPLAPAGPPITTVADSDALGARGGDGSTVWITPLSAPRPQGVRGRTVVSPEDTGLVHFHL